MNETSTGTEIDQQLTKHVPEVFTMNGSKENYLYQLDCQMRREKDPTKKMQIELLMAQIKDGSPEVEPYLKRHVELMIGDQPDDQTK